MSKDNSAPSPNIVRILYCIRAAILSAGILWLTHDPESPLYISDRDMRIGFDLGYAVLTICCCFPVCDRSTASEDNTYVPLSQEHTPVGTTKHKSDRNGDIESQPNGQSSSEEACGSIPFLRRDGK